MSKPILFAISGVKNSGKTTFIGKLLPVLNAKGLKVAVIKHDGHEFEPDVPGTDTWQHLQAGACGTAVFSNSRCMAVKKQCGVTETDLSKLFPEADLILLEGFKYSTYPKIELVRKGNSEKSICPPENLKAILSDFIPRHPDGIPVLPLNDVESTAQIILKLL